MTTLTYFAVSGDYRNVSDPDLGGRTNDPEVEIISGFVTFHPRLPEGFLTYIDDYDVVPATNEVQRVNLTNAVGGTFRLTFNGQQTATIPYNATVAQVRTALEALSSVGANNVAVTGDSGGPWYVEFRGALAANNVSVMTINTSGLTAAPPQVLVSTMANGAPSVNEVQRIQLVNTTGGSFPLIYAGRVTQLLPFNSSAAAVQAALRALPPVGDNNISVAGGNGGPWTVEFIGVLGGKSINSLKGGNAQLTGVGADVTVTTLTEGVSPVNEVQKVFVAAVGGTFTLTYSGQTTAPIPYNANITTVRSALENLSNVNDGDIHVAGSAGNYYITFVGTKAGTNQAPLVASSAGLASALAGGTVGTVVVGTPVQTRPTAIAFPPRKARIWEGMLCTINVEDTPGVDLVANSAALKLYEQGVDQLIYDVQFSSVVYAEGSRTLRNFAFVAPYDSTPVVLSSLALPKLDYKGP